MVNITLTPANDKAKKAKKKRLEAELLRLLTENDQSDVGRLKVLAVAMAYFHGVAQKAITNEVFASITSLTEGINVKLNTKVYLLPISNFKNPNIRGFPSIISTNRNWCAPSLLFLMQLILIIGHKMVCFNTTDA